MLPTTLVYNALYCITVLTSVASVRLLMPLAMLCFRSKSISVIVVLFYIKVIAYLYKVTEKKSTCIYCCIMWLIPGPQERRNLILPGSVVHYNI